VSELRFEWDRRKAELNVRKHGVTFEEAATVFNGPVLREYDLVHGPEEREIVIGFSYRARLLFVVIYEYEEDTIRIISARRASRVEGQRYFAEN
jgi:uncharacterized DUF497 family protein